MSGLNFREHVVLSLIREAGHTPTAVTDGWVRCSRCYVEWWVSKRAAIADDPTVTVTASNGAEVKIANPLDFGRCERLHP